MKVWKLAQKLDVRASEILKLTDGLTANSDLAAEDVKRICAEIRKQHHSYFWHGNEPAIFREIYLPKKAHYQKTLFQILTTGFKLNYPSHFKGKKEAKIRQFLKLYQAGIARYEELANDGNRV